MTRRFFAAALAAFMLAAPAMTLAQESALGGATLPYSETLRASATKHVVPKHSLKKASKTGKTGKTVKKKGRAKTSAAPPK